jgi:hypothetical protein
MLDVRLRKTEYVMVEKGSRVAEFMETGISLSSLSKKSVWIKLKKLQPS